MSIKSPAAVGPIGTIVLASISLTVSIVSLQILKYILQWCK